MKKCKISNTDERELRRFRQFYTVYGSAKYYIMNQNSNREVINPDLSVFKNDLIRGTTNCELEIPENHYQRIFS